MLHNNGLILLVALSSFCVTNAFSTARPSRHLVLPARASSLRLFSSIDPNEEDELSRLIGKRNEIKRKKKAEEEPVERDTLEFDISEQDIEWDNLPEFKTSRPSRKKKPSSDDQKKKKQQEEKDAGLDFLVDYQDENEFHIPNRIGISTISWGDPSRNFVPKGKLTKKMRREGKFVPGDLQVCMCTRSVGCGGVECVLTLIRAGRLQPIVGEWRHVFRNVGTLWIDITF